MLKITDLGPFRAARWEVARFVALEQTTSGWAVESAKGLGLSMGLTDRFYDIDIAADLKQLAAKLQRMPERAPSRAKDWANERRD